MASSRILASRKLKGIIFIFGIALIMGVWSGLFLFLRAERNHIEMHAYKDTATYARMFAEHSVRTLRGLDQIALFLKYQAEKEGLHLDVRRYLEEGRFEGQPFVLISLVDEKGNLISGSQTPAQPVNIADRDHFAVHRYQDSGLLHISKPVLGRTTGKWSIVLTRRINRADGSFGGVAAVSTDPYYFARFYQSMSLGPKSVIALVGRDGMARVRQVDEFTEVGREFRHAVVMEQLLQGDSGSFFTDRTLDGVNRYFSYVALTEYPLFVTVGVSEELAFAGLNQLLPYYYGAAVALSLIIVLFLGMIWSGLEERRNTEVQQILKEIANASVVCRSHGDLFAAVQRLVEKNLPADHFQINLLDEVSGELILAYRGSGAALLPDRRPLDKGLTEYTLCSNEPVLLKPSEIESLRESGEYTLGRDQKIHIAQYLGAPLVNSRQQTLGVISIHTLDMKRTFDQEDREIFALIASQLTQGMERIETEEDLRRTGSYLHKLIEYASEPIVVWNSEQVITHFNRAFEKLSGYCAEEVIGLLVSTFWRERGRADLMEQIQKIQEGAQLESVEISFHRKTGEEVVAIWNSANIYEADGTTLTGVIVQGTDITERVRRANELRQDLELATRVQRALLRRQEPSPFVEIETIFEPVGYVGGDLYFLDWRSDGMLLRGFLIDVMGHGLATALHTASLHALLREANEQDRPLSEMMRWLNQRAKEYFDPGTFAGAIGFELDLDTRRLRWCCAGIPRFFLSTKIRRGKVDCPGMFLGILREETFDLHECEIAAGDSVYFLTDGLSDMLMEQKELPLADFSAMVRLLRENLKIPLRRDDASAICLHLRKLPEPVNLQQGWPRLIRLKGYGDYLRYKEEFTRILHEITGKPHSLQEVAINEALANALECRDGQARNQNALVKLNRFGDHFVVRVKTSRIGFAGNAMLRRLCSQPEAMFSFGEDASMGRGIPLMLSIADKMTYNHDGTEVLLAWKIKK